MDDELNIWGTPKSDVCDGYCEDCERPEPLHYRKCPKYFDAESAAKELGI